MNKVALPGLLVGLVGTLYVVPVSQPQQYPPQPAPVVKPQYGTGYDPYGEKFDEMIRVLKAIEAKTGGGAAAVPESVARQQARELVLQKRCAGCHTPTQVRKTAPRQKLILWNDDAGKTLRVLSPEEDGRVAAAIRDGSMPPGGREKCTETEQNLFDGK